MSLWTWSPTNSSLGRPLHLTEERADPKTDEREGAAPRLVKSMAPNSFVRLACGGGHALALTGDGRLYAWGWNSYGQLGGGAGRDDASRPQAVPAFTGLRCGCIAAGAAHSAALVWDDRVAGVPPAVRCYTWGAHGAGQLGHPSAEAHGSPREVDALSELRLAMPTSLEEARATAAGAHLGEPEFEPLACGAAHTALVTADGALWAWGCNASGQLGHQRLSAATAPAPVLALQHERVAQVSCGAAHTLALTGKGKVLAFGLNATGQLGNGGASNGATPTPAAVRLPAGVAATAIAAGEEFSCALTAEGRLFTWGYGGCGQLGHGSTASLKLPREAATPEPVVAVSCGGGHVLARTARGGVLRWGHEGSWDALQRATDAQRAAAALPTAMRLDHEGGGGATAEAQPMAARAVGAGRCFSAIIGEPLPVMASDRAVGLIQGMWQGRTRRRRRDEAQREGRAAEVLARRSTAFLARRALREAAAADERRRREVAATRMQAVARRRAAQGEAAEVEREKKEEEERRRREAAIAALPPPKDPSPRRRAQSTVAARRVGGGFAPRQPPGAPADGSPRRRVTLANPGAAERPSPRRRVTLAS